MRDELRRSSSCNPKIMLLDILRYCNLWEIGKCISKRQQLFLALASSPTSVHPSSSRVSSPDDFYVERSRASRTQKRRISSTCSIRGRIRISAFWRNLLFATDAPDIARMGEAGFHEVKVSLNEMKHYVVCRSTHDLKLTWSDLWSIIKPFLHLLAGAVLVCWSLCFIKHVGFHDAPIMRDNVWSLLFESSDLRSITAILKFHQSVYEKPYLCRVS